MSGLDVTSRKTLVFVVTEDWYFVSHRLPLAVAARHAGYQVVVASRFSSQEPLLKSHGLTLRPIRLRRRGNSLVGEASAILELRRIYQEFAPAIVHHVALKPVVFGSLAAIGLQRIAVVNAVAGLGFVFTSQRWLARALRPVIDLGLRSVLRRRRSVIIVQNESDRAQLLARGLASPDAVRLIGGAGVELDVFKPSPEPGGVPIVAFAGRLLWDKGVGQLVDAARILRSRGVAGRFVLIGEPDLDNPTSVPIETLRGWEREGVVELWGRRSDMPAALSSVHVVCLPSTYGEGVPKILLEAAACGRPVVTTDWPGCRDVVRDGETGILVPPGNPEALAEALERLLRDPALRREYGEAGRKLAEREFDVRSVVAATLAIYEGLAEETAGSVGPTAETHASS